MKTLASFQWKLLLIVKGNLTFTKAWIIRSETIDVEDWKLT